MAAGESQAVHMLEHCLTSRTEALGDVGDLRPSEVVDAEALNALSA